LKFKPAKAKVNNLPLHDTHYAGYVKRK